MNLYDYEVSDSNVEVRLAAENSSRLHYEVSFFSPGSTSWTEDRTVYGELFVPQNRGKVPLVIITHGLGDASLAPCLTLARLLIKQGIATYIWYLPTHSRRLPEAMKGKYLMATPGEWLEVYRCSVMELRRAIDWLSTREEIDQNRIAVTGNSLGGSISCKYPVYLAEVKKKGLENVTPAKECFQFDPITFAHRIPPRPMLMINGENDEMVPGRSVTELWEACGKPSLVWVPDTHVGTYCQSSLISSKIVEMVNLIPG
jgi:dienelactone hydrolase